MYLGLEEDSFGIVDEEFVMGFFSSNVKRAREKYYIKHGWYPNLSFPRKLSEIEKGIVRRAMINTGALELGKIVLCNFPEKPYESREINRVFGVSSQIVDIDGKRYMIFLKNKK